MKAGLLNEFIFNLLPAFLLLLIPFIAFSQVDIQADVLFSPNARNLTIKQEIKFVNQAEIPIKEIYLSDWNNAFRDKDSPLGKQFTLEYLKRFHYSDLDERGQTKVDYIKSDQQISWKRLDDQPDLICINLEEELAPSDSLNLSLQYALRIPQDRFTGFGVNPEGDFNLKYWLIAPVANNDPEKLYSHQNLNDHDHPLMNVDLKIKIPEDYQLYSYLLKQEITGESNLKNYRLFGENHHQFPISLIRTESMDQFMVDTVTVYSSIEANSLPKVAKQKAIDRIFFYLSQRVGAFPHNNLLITEADYKANPIFGLNELPDLLRPFDPEFIYELKVMKTLTRNYLENMVNMDTRAEGWVLDAIEIYLLMDYIETFHPEKKLIGKLSEIIGIRWTHLADLKFNEQFAFLFMNMNRMNLDQPLSMSKDSLVRFNREIANPYKGGVGLHYLKDFSETDLVNKSIKEFFRTYYLKNATALDFEEILQRNSTKNIDWFFKDYVHLNTSMDYKIKKVENTGDSLEVTIKNKHDNRMPVPLYGMDKGKVVSKYWIESEGKWTNTKIPAEKITKLGLNTEGVIPEINRRDNYKNLKGILNKPVQFRLLKDVEDPRFTQFFLGPEFSYNLYDGFTAGSRISNMAVLPKNFSYTVVPKYGFGSKTLLGSFGISNKHPFKNKNLSSITYGIVGNRYSYTYDSFYHRLTPYLRFNWRHRDLRNKQRNSLNIRNVTVHRDFSETMELDNRPNYNVFNVRYAYSDRNLINSISSVVDYQVANKFSKVSLTAKYRKLFLNNRQLEFRFFAGAFLYNKTDSDYFSFALDRPSDYLFDYNYYGRSESSGFFSQQFIAAEGGFKSKLPYNYADQWMSTFNVNASLYRDLLFAYGDVGMLKNSSRSAKIRYDSGIRLSLIQDYFELYLPVYSNLGWEIAQPDYDKKLRFVITLDFQTLLGLFERSYY